MNPASCFQSPRQLLEFPGFRGSQQPTSELALAGPLPTPSSLAPPSAAQSVVATTTPANGDAALRNLPAHWSSRSTRKFEVHLVRRQHLLDYVAADGTLTPVFRPLQSSDAPSTRRVPRCDDPPRPAADAGSLSDRLGGGSSASQYLDDGSWDSSADQPLADFTVVQPGMTLKDATDLGHSRTQVQKHLRFARSLDWTELRRPVQVHDRSRPFWPLGVELDALSADRQRFAWSASPSSIGQDMSWPRATQVPGLRALPLTLPLHRSESGVYYIGVSGEGNLAGEIGGYNPVDGTVGTAGLPQAGAGFDLKLVAERADAPTSRDWVHSHWQDPL